MRFSLALVGMVSLFGVAHAEPPTVAVAATAAPPAPPTVEQPARRYAHGSWSVLGGATFTSAFIGDSQAGTGFQAMALSGSIAVRKVLKVGLTIQPRIGADAFLATSKSGIYAVLAPRVGLGVGWTLALGRMVATTPMLHYDALYLVGGVSQNLTGFMHIVALELPLAVFLGRNAFIELFLDGGVVAAFGQVAPTITAGYRVGLVL